MPPSALDSMNSSPNARISSGLDVWYSMICTNSIAASSSEAAPAWADRGSRYFQEPPKGGRLSVGGGGGAEAAQAAGGHGQPDRGHQGQPHNGRPAVGDTVAPQVAGGVGEADEDGLGQPPRRQLGDAGQGRAQEPFDAG